MTTGRLAHYDPLDQERIKNLMCRLVEEQVASGAIDCTDEAIKAALPQALEDATAIMSATWEFLS